MWVRVCLDFVMCLCGFCNVWVCVGMCFEICGCFYVWIF